MKFRKRPTLRSLNVRLVFGMNETFSFDILGPPQRPGWEVLPIKYFFIGMFVYR